MSKSMWIDAVESKPIKGDNPKFSVKVLYWREGEEAPTWGYFNHGTYVWVDGMYRQIYQPETVKYFAYIDNPYK